MANSNRKRCSIGPIFRETQIRITMRYYLTQVRMAIVKKKNPQITNAGEGVAKREPSYTATMENSTESPQKIKNRAAV